MIYKKKPQSFKKFKLINLKMFFKFIFEKTKHANLFRFITLIITIFCLTNIPI